jgi:hypothetical protein
MDFTMFLTFAPALIVAAAGYFIRQRHVSKKTLNELSAIATWAVRAAEEEHERMPNPMKSKLDSALERFGAATGIEGKEAEAVILATVKSLREAGLLGAAEKTPNKLHVIETGHIEAPDGAA